MLNKSVTLFRGKKDSKQVLGFFQILDEYGKVITFSPKTIEKLSTLIISGVYRCLYTKSPRFSKMSIENWKKENPNLKKEDAPEEIQNIFTFEITGVIGRAGLRIHSVNFSRDLEGCIALGNSYQDLDKDGEEDLINSRITIKQFEDLMERKPFQLTIK